MPANALLTGEIEFYDLVEAESEQFEVNLEIDQSAATCQANRVGWARPAT